MAMLKNYIKDGVSKKGGNKQVNYYALKMKNYKFKQELFLNRYNILILNS